MNIVSGFISNINRRSDRDITKYLQFGFQLMAVQIPMTIFIERRVFETHIIHQLLYPKKGDGVFVYHVRGGVMDGMQYSYSYQTYGHITFVFFEMTDLVLLPYRAMAHKFSLNTGNPSKDTLEYMMVQCQKTEWMAIAMAMNASPVQLKEYVWFDFGVFHMFHGKIDVFQIELYYMQSRIQRRIFDACCESAHIRFASCWNPNMVYYGDIYKDVNWLFAGSVFGGGFAVLNEFAMKMREKCLQVLREKNTLMWEINIWAILYREEPNYWCQLYSSDHSEMIVRGYC
jgi:hypothetical protein